MVGLQKHVIIYLVAYFTYSLAKPEVSLKKTRSLHLIQTLKLTKDNLQELARRLLPPISVMPKPNHIVYLDKTTINTVNLDSSIDTITTELYAETDTTAYNLEDFYTDTTTESDISTTDTVTTEDYEDIEFRLSLPSEAIASLVG